MLRIWLDMCAAHGVDEVLINVHSHADQVRAFIDEQKRSAVSVRITEEVTLLGSAGTVAANRDWVENEDSFWIVFADVLTNSDLSAMLSFHQGRRQLATLGLYRVADPCRCGIANLNDFGIVSRFTEKPAVPESNLAFSGLMLATPAVLDYIPSCCPADIGFHLLPQLVGRMAGYMIDSYLIDIGTMENLEAAQHTWPGLVYSCTLSKP
jgi:mannose-1-phosphate guanylyltransferase